MYLKGFGNHHQSEAIAGALPINQNSPQCCAMGLYAEQLSGTAFTRPRHNNLHSWLYRILPSAVQGSYHSYQQRIIQPYAKNQSPNPLRWSPFKLFSDIKSDFIDGLIHIAGSNLVNAFVYTCNESMHDTYFANNDGEMLFVPYLGTISLYTEFGKLIIKPG
ncbi:MAG: homogentisate 1,2-dioxygenase, partial [bacterium]|nr:homogentisate 1,2-dioxygenase [bacterium]